ncbi:ABC transporter ATP-binding protein [Sporolactobacillus pectinivorans]|uniref:ABC transporter ATP-binding protein n=1 Tax=Sporolactobacillus pectinivorans TaxID=1591408 RepID=UPI000C257381|nr:ABC transporter ATP-binding protein [Sporolactobacillus pectinivorans]
MIIEVKDLVKRYKNFLAIDHLNLTIDDGEIFGLLGPNGAGKTTLVNTVLGLTSVDQGHITVFGEEMGKHEREIKKQIGLVPQDIAVYDELTAYENVRLFGKLFGLKGEVLKIGVSDALEFTGLTHLQSKKSSQFSGGMKRRLNIACAIVHKPKLIIMDEPTVGIDPQSRNYILESVKKLNQMGCTVIYISHYMEEVAAICSQIAIVDKGRIIAKGTKEELSKLIVDDQIVSVDIDSPNYTLIEKLKGLSEVKDASIEGQTVRIIMRVMNMNAVLSAFLEVGITVTKVATNTPTLEDVFLTLTGRALREGSH